MSIQLTQGSPPVTHPFAPPVTMLMIIQFGRKFGLFRTTRATTIWGIPRLSSWTHRRSCSRLALRAKH